jgi:Cation transporting ATPase, C-terminus
MFFGVVFGDAIGLELRTGALVLPLTATQLLWINLVTDGAPALALGVDAGDPDSMERPPRPATERVITGPMWRGIFFIGVVMAAGTLYVLDADLPGGLFQGTGSLRHGQTMAFTTLMQKPLVVGCDRGVPDPAGCCRVRAISSTGVFDGAAHRVRLDALHDGRQYRSVAS